MLSIIIPVWNEEATIRPLVEKVLRVDTSKEVLVVDDGSRDRTYQILSEIPSIQVFRHDENQGKGAAIRTALRHIRGDLVVIQDGDLEYDPQDYLKMIACFQDQSCQVVYGSRILGERIGLNQKHSSFWFYWGGRFLSGLTSLLWGCKITDEATCYKMFRRELLDKIRLESRGFEICVEMTSKFLKEGCTIHEIPIRYNPRKMQEGKKIRWHDGLKAIGFLLKYRFL